MERSIQVQAQIRRDAEEHGRALRELQEWGEEMKRREEEERQQEEEGDAGTQVLAAAAAMVHPGRAIEDGRNDNGGGDQIGGGANGYHVDDANRSPMDMASAERQRGNDCYAAGRYDDAIKCYTACLVFDPHSAVAYSNRAMAHLKKRDWRKAEDDATSALAIDASHVKSYHRRSVARASLGMLRAALLDLSRAEAELELLEEDGSGGGDKTTPRNLQKSIASERRRVESLLRAAMKRAPKRCNVPIVVVRDEEEGKEEAAKEEEDDDASVADDAIMAKENDVDNDSARDASRESDDWVMVGTGDSGKEATRTNNNTTCTTGSSPAKPLRRSTRRQHEKPKTWYDFETTWRSLDSLEERSAYLSSIKPKWLAVLYRNGVEDVEIVVGIVVAAAAMLVEEESNNKAAAAAEYIRCVANTKSIDIPAMMMDDGQRKQVREAIGKVFGGDDGGDVAAAKLGCS